MAFYETTLKLRAVLHPSHTMDIAQGVEAQLNSLLMRFHRELGGVVLSYSQVELLASSGRIIDEEPWIRIPASAKCLLFRPRDGLIMDGVVNNLGGDFIGLLVFGTFNVSIPVSKMGEDCEYSEEGGCWYARGHAIREGSSVRFSVAGVTVAANGLITLQGSLLDEGTGPIEASTTGEDVEEEEEEETKKQKKEKKSKKDKKEKKEKKKRKSRESGDGDEVQGKTKKAKTTDE
eukprot:TRINITY_DN1361_c0_g2_i1.p1 TRINITY_DN1361_c0_g2~~TRINITY_DN1361_c0_g2_i1.p1  ORF type:complete len:233 (-),score=52.31 TRINITY_DN1361_c0_g2_i1:144-842(-)